MWHRRPDVRQRVPAVVVVVVVVETVVVTARQRQRVPAAEDIMS